MRAEDERLFRRAIELNLPIESYWHLNKMIKEADYTMANEQSVADVKALYTKIFQFSASFAIKEADRDWLYKMGRGIKVPD